MSRSLVLRWNVRSDQPWDSGVLRQRLGLATALKPAISVLEFRAMSNIFRAADYTSEEMSLDVKILLTRQGRRDQRPHRPHKSLRQTATAISPRSLAPLSDPATTPS